MASEVKCWCQHCNKELDLSHTGSCPYCSETGKRCVVTINATVGIKASVSAKRTRVYFEWGNREIRYIIGKIGIGVVFTSVSTLVGFFVGGALGALIGFLVSLAIDIIYNLFFNRKVKTKVREIKEYQ